MTTAALKREQLVPLASWGTKTREISTTLGGFLDVYLWPDGVRYAVIERPPMRRPTVVGIYPDVEACEAALKTTYTRRVREGKAPPYTSSREKELPPCLPCPCCKAHPSYKYVQFDGRWVLGIKCVCGLAMSEVEPALMAFGSTARSYYVTIMQGVIERWNKRAV